MKRAHGHVAYETNCLPSNCTQTGNKVAAIYDHAGHVTQLTYPDGRVVKSTLSQGFLQSVTYDNWNGQSVNYPYLSSATYAPDGTVTTARISKPGDRAPSESFSYFTGGGETSPEAWVEHTTTSGSHPEATTTYYLADQIGSTRMTLAYGGWAMSQSTYYPFGVEPAPPASQNQYKFSGKERDPASGLDNFGARYYSAVMGRFMTPDWSAQPEPVPYAKLDNPQSLNLYSYVLNNPLTGIDVDGHDPYATNKGVPCGGQSDGVKTNAQEEIVPKKNPCPRSAPTVPDRPCITTASCWVHVYATLPHDPNRSGSDLSPGDVPLNPYANALFHQLARQTIWVQHAEHKAGCTGEAAVAGAASFFGVSPGAINPADPVGSTLELFKRGLHNFSNAGGPQAMATYAFELTKSPAFERFVGESLGKMVPIAGEFLTAGSVGLAATEAVKEYGDCY